MSVSSYASFVRLVGVGVACCQMLTNFCIGQEAAKPVFLTGVSVVDVVQARIVENQAIEIVSGRIKSVGPMGQVSMPADAQQIQLDGMFVLPGLIDLHTHLLLHP